MEIRILKYFLTVAREQNITRAAETLHITQPTLSRQIAALEAELGTPLFERNNKKITLTKEGILLKRRALEILELEEKTVEELQSCRELVEGSITIGCGEYEAVESLAEICASFRAKYPKVQIRLHTATADVIRNRMTQGLVDIGLFMEPISTEGLDYVRLKGEEVWVVSMRPDDPLAGKAHITKEDLLNKPLILPERANVQSELANWFGREYAHLNIAFTSNLLTNAAMMAKRGLGYPITVKGSMKFWKEENLTCRELFPKLCMSAIIAWRRNIPYSQAVLKFIEEIHAFQASKAI